MQTPKSLNPITSLMSGQPTKFSHPHLIRDGQVGYGMELSELKSRRVRLMESLENNSIAILFSAPMRFYSQNIFHGYRQDSNFLYMTGWNEPESVLVMYKNNNTIRSTMFCQEKNHRNETWNGPVNGIELAVERFGFDEAFPISQLESHLNELVDTTMVTSADSKTKHSTIKMYVDLPTNKQIQDMRVIKSENEIKLLQTAANISKYGFQYLLKSTKEGVTQDVLATGFEYHSKLGAKELSPLTQIGYVPVFASGDQNLILHYVQNNKKLRNGELMLVDAGMEFSGYNADVSRTIPVSGKFSPPQRDLYNAILDVLEQSTKLLYESSGNTLNDVHLFSENLMIKNLKKLDFRSSGIEKDVIRNVLYPHHISHYLGLSVHDTGSVSRSRKLKAGMVVTVEPGIYVPYDDMFPKHFQGIGIRIEDNVVVGKTEKDINVLTAEIPKTVEDVEKAMSQ
ncbi:hypothetical protein BB558_007635 [Smittium angustum]|uniref:Aminopeptidase P N-terminal domain-containing protein n=1 Tax=Smittium angustum TaxID=133377 RepID=A0A2U1IUJ7_SMIAN|nr:hypothetical protein BB558_007635 [Smittium angustum]